MAITKNDCFDCANCIPKELRKRDSGYICAVTNKSIPSDGIFDISVDNPWILENGDCSNFKYSE